MIDEYYQSEEKYKGFVLKIRCYRLHSSLNYHRCCDIFNKDGIRIGVSKTKREAKELIKGGYIRG